MNDLDRILINQSVILEMLAILCKGKELSNGDSAELCALSLSKRSAEYAFRNQNNAHDQKNARR